VSGLIFLVTLGFTSIFTFKFQSIISGPILSLAKVVKEISKTTDYTIRVKHSSEDELGTLYSGFNDMLEKIEKRENELAEHRENLEKMVDKRTLELARVVSKLGDLNELKNKFLGIASHDLRNPIYVIRSFSEILQDSSLGPINEKQRRLLRKISNNSEFMQGLLDNLLDISKIESGKISINKEQNDFHDLVINQIEFHQLLANKKKISLHFEKKELPPLAFDKNAISQAVSNYLGNAVKFSPLESHIYITIKILDEKIQFLVKDEGPGISNEDQKLLFGEFQTLSAQPTGGEKSTGLGLAIVKKLVHLHGGDVGVTSEIGQGATFFFTLPTGK
jgi:signal transduction histidine kinase